MRTKKNYHGKEIITEYASSNIKGANFHIENKKLKITFASGVIYEYADVPHEIFSGFDNADSQGVYFNKNIAKKYSFQKL